MSNEGNWLKDDLKKAEARIAELEKKIGRLDRWLKDNPGLWYGNEASAGDTIGLVLAVLGNLVDSKNNNLHLRTGLERVLLLVDTDCGHDSPYPTCVPCMAKHALDSAGLEP